MHGPMLPASVLWLVALSFVATAKPAELPIQFPEPRNPWILLAPAQPRHRIQVNGAYTHEYVYISHQQILVLKTGIYPSRTWIWKSTKKEEIIEFRGYPDDTAIICTLHTYINDFSLIFTVQNLIFKTHPHGIGVV